jgi:hypothetical protein
MLRGRHAIGAATLATRMKYADLELTNRGEFPHDLRAPQFVNQLDKNIPWYFSTFTSMYHWPVLGDNWSDLKAPEKEGDVHMFYTLAWWKLGEGIVDDHDADT